MKKTPALFVAGSSLFPSLEMAALAGHLDSGQTATWVAVSVEEKQPDGDMGRRGCQTAALS
jgi:hypothetical protein